MTMPTGPGKVSESIRSIRAVSSPVPSSPGPGRAIPASAGIDRSAAASAASLGVGRSAAGDACPGALRLHEAADGPLARVRIPGGRITGAQLRVLREIAEEWGDGHVELTSRANLQLRALNGAPAVRLADRLAAAGLLPSQTHELVRNIAASPLIPDPAPIAALDRALCADAALAALPGRFLFAVDSGAGDVAFSADVASLPAGDRIAVLFAGRDAGLRVGPAQIVPALLEAAHAFLALAEETVAAGQPRPWRLRELDNGPARAAAKVAEALHLPLGDPSPELSRPTPHEPIGVIGGTAVAALVPLGRLTPPQLTTLSTAAVLVVTPWRGIVVADLTPAEAALWADRLAAVGLQVTEGSPWAGVTTCAGRPGCAKALADVRSDASAAVEASPTAGLPTASSPAAGSPAGSSAADFSAAGSADAGRDGLPAVGQAGLSVAGSPAPGPTGFSEGGLPAVEQGGLSAGGFSGARRGSGGSGLAVHWVGCARGCGSPPGPHVRVEATGSGYLVAGPHGGGTAAADEVAALVAAVRKG